MEFAFTNSDFVGHIGLMGQVGQITYENAVKTGAGTRPTKMFEVSSIDNPIPHAPTDFHPDPPHLTLLEAKKVELRTFYTKVSSSPEYKDILSQVENAWAEAELKLARLIDDYVSAMEDVVFPINTFTRRKAHFHGSSLHLPGLIKAVITDFNYKKFFSAKLAGGRCSYSVAIAVDVSLSMSGHFGQCAVDTLVCLIASLRRIGIDNFSLVLFGENVRYVHGC